MTSEIGDFDKSSGTVSTNSQKNTTISGSSKIALVAFVVTGVAGIVIIALGSINTFGSVGSTGFIVSVSVGGACTCLAIGGIIWIAIINCKKQKAAESKAISVPKLVTANTTDPTNPEIAPKKMPKVVEQHEVIDTEDSTQSSHTTSPQQSTNEKKNKPSTQLKNERGTKHEEGLQAPSTALATEMDQKEKVHREDAVPSIQAKLVATVDPELEKQRILEVYGQQMVDALGGAEKIMSFPVLNKPPSGDISTFPAGHFVRGESDFGPFLSFCYKTYDDGWESYSYPKHECWIRDKEAKTWRIVQIGISNFLSPKGRLELADDNNTTKFLIDRIRRLASGEPIGCLESLSRKQLLLDDYIPDNAYLKDSELTEYMTLGISYEKDPKDCSEIISWDPKQSTESNRERLRREHPHQNWKSDNMAWPSLK